MASHLPEALQAANIRNSLLSAKHSGAVALAVAVTGFAAAGNIERASASESSNSDAVALCEQDALDSYAYTPNSNTFAYIRHRRTSNRFIRWSISANSMPAECNGVVTRSISVKELIGTHPNHLVANTSNSTVSRSNGPINELKFTQQTIHPYHNGEYIQGIETITASPVQGGHSVSEQHPTTIVSVR